MATPDEAVQRLRHIKANVGNQIVTLIRDIEKISEESADDEEMNDEEMSDEDYSDHESDYFDNENDADYVDEGSETTVDTEDEDSSDSDSVEIKFEFSSDRESDNGSDTSMLPKHSPPEPSTKKTDTIEARKRSSPHVVIDRPAKKNSACSKKSARGDANEDFSFDISDVSKTSHKVLDALKTLALLTRACVRIVEDPESSARVVEAALVGVDSQYAIFSHLRERQHEES